MKAANDVPHRKPYGVYMYGPNMFVEHDPPYARVNLNVRPWPVNPLRYPLNGPSHGPMYAPPPYNPMLWQTVKVYALCAAYTFGFGAIVYGLINCVVVGVKWLALH